MSHLISRCPGGHAAPPHPGVSAGGTGPQTWRTAPCPPAPGRPCLQGAADTGALSTGATSERCRGSSPRGLGKRVPFSLQVLVHPNPKVALLRTCGPGHVTLLGVAKPGPDRALRGSVEADAPEKRRVRGRRQGPKTNLSQDKTACCLCTPHCNQASGPPRPFQTSGVQPWKRA